MLNTAITEANMIRVINRKNPVLMTLDSCFSMAKGSDRFLKEKVFPYLNGKKIFVEVAVLSELHKHAIGPDSAKAQAAKNALVFINQHRQYFQIVGKETDGGSLADTSFLSLISKRIGRYHIVLLTEDKDLIRSLQALFCGMSCVHHKRSLTIISFSKNRMQSWYDPTSGIPHKNSGTFKLKFPNAVVFTDDAKAIRLGKSIGSGAKSRVFEIEGDPSHVAKILHPSVFENDRSYNDFFKRVNTLMDLEIAHESLVLPKELLYDSNGPDKNPVGYLMKGVEGGKTLHALISQGKLSFTERITIIFQLAIALEHLQQNGISIPDLRLDNLMFDGKKCLKIIDSDGFDIPGAPHEQSNNVLYNSPVGFTGDATAFRFALISWQIFTGKHPFLNPNISIRDAINSYQFILTSDRKDAMDCLTEELRQAYVDTFHGKTMSMTKWNELWSNYLEDILEAMKGYSAV